MQLPGMLDTNVVRGENDCGPYDAGICEGKAT